MTRERFKTLHRAARLGDLGSLACTLPGDVYQWFLREVYDLRFPHFGEDRRRVDDLLTGRDFKGQCRFNSHCCGGTLHRRLANWHQARGWMNCFTKPILRLWVEYKAVCALPWQQQRGHETRRAA